MAELNIESSTAKFPFTVKTANGQHTFRKVMKNSDGTGIALVVNHTLGDHLTIEFRSIYKKPDKGGKAAFGEKRILLYPMDCKSTVAFASILMFLADEKLRDSSEVPYYRLVTSKEKSSFGINWIHEDYETAVDRTEKRKARSYLYCLARRCIETTDDKDFLFFLFINLAQWADQSGDEYSMQIAEKAVEQLGFIPREWVN
jgi:hypothetical protein